MGFVVEYVDKERFAEFASPANRQAVDKAGLHVNWELCARGDDRWAIDRERNAYFFAMSVMDHNGPFARFYLLNFEGSPIVIRIHSGKKVAPLDIPAGLEGRLDDIHKAIRDALAVIGYGGIGRLNKYDAIPPNFEPSMGGRP